MGKREWKRVEIKRIWKLSILKLKKWENASLLVDTGSSSTIAGRKLTTKIGWIEKAEACPCKMATAVGSATMLGEIKINLMPLSGNDRNSVVHIADIPEKLYDASLGTDILREFRGYAGYKRGRWKIPFGNVSFKAAMTVGAEEQLGVTVVRECESGLNVNEKEINKEFERAKYR